MPSAETEAATKHTPGPWQWFGNARNSSLYLATPHSGRRFVMQFDRWGMRGAQPRFRVDGRMVAASTLLQFEVGNRDVVGVEQAKADDSVYRLDVRGIAHPDAALIAAAPELLEALRLMVAAYAIDGFKDRGLEVRAHEAARASIAAAEG